MQVISIYFLIVQEEQGIQIAITYHGAITQMNISLVIYWLASRYERIIYTIYYLTSGCSNVYVKTID